MTNGKDYLKGKLRFNYEWLFNKYNSCPILIILLIRINKKTINDILIYLIHMRIQLLIAA